MGKVLYTVYSLICCLATFNCVLGQEIRGSTHYEKRKEACEDFNLAFKNGHSKAITLMKKNCKEYFN